MIRFIQVFMVVLLLTAIQTAHAASPGADDFFQEGYMASMSREWDTAVSLYGKAIELNPRHAEAYFQRALTLEVLGRIDEAVKDYEQILRFDPHHYLALEYLAKLYESRGEYGKAIDLYGRALPLVSDPKWKSIIRWWISEAMRKGRQQSNGSHRPAHGQEVTGR